MVTVNGSWSDEQNEAIVADYFAMLADDLAGRDYSKADHNRRLQRTTGRPRGAIEYKHQNISAVLKGLGQTFIPGYKPAFNYHLALEDVVVRWLDRHPNWLSPRGAATRVHSANGFSEDPILHFGTPPTRSNQPPPPMNSTRWPLSPGNSTWRVAMPEIRRSAELARSAFSFTNTRG